MKKTHRSCSTFWSNADSRSVKRMLLYKSCNLKFKKFNSLHELKKKNLNISNFPFGQVASTFCLPKIHVYRGIATSLVCCSFVLVSMYDLLEDDLDGPLPSGPMSVKSNLRSGVLLSFLFGRQEEKDTWYIYFMRCLPVVQNLDFCLIGRKTKDPSDLRYWLATNNISDSCCSLDRFCHLGFFKTETMRWSRNFFNSKLYSLC